MPLERAPVVQERRVCRGSMGSASALHKTCFQRRGPLYIVHLRKAEKFPTTMTEAPEHSDLVFPSNQESPPKLVADGQSDIWV